MNHQFFITETLWPAYLRRASGMNSIELVAHFSYHDVVIGIRSCYIRWKLSNRLFMDHIALWYITCIHPFGTWRFKGLVYMVCTGHQKITWLRQKHAYWVAPVKNSRTAVFAASTRQSAVMAFTNTDIGILQCFTRLAVYGWLDDFWFALYWYAFSIAQYSHQHKAYTTWC